MQVHAVFRVAHNKIVNVTDLLNRTSINAIEIQQNLQIVNKFFIVLWLLEIL